MHELAITESLVDCVCESVGEGRVLRVVVEIGKRSAVMPEAVRVCFERVREGNRARRGNAGDRRAAGEELKIREVEVI